MIRIFYILFLAVWVIHMSQAVCWDTGCQLDSWATRGCEQYDMNEIERRNCENGSIYSCCDKNNSSRGSKPVIPSACWETGCQLNSWAVRGCEQYGMVEIKQQSCENGIIYSCCDKNGTLTEIKSGSSTCWDTGCQLNSWAVRGCEQYDKVEIRQQPCDNGIKYTCCDKNNSTIKPKPAPSTCWDTGCQLNSWAVRGCEQYDKVEIKQQPCDNGIIYTCCDKNNSLIEPKSAPSTCWDTGCQLNSWAVRGCEQYDRDEIRQQLCTNGIIYTCCEKNSTNRSKQDPKSCWDTGCQLNSWAVRGCEQYGKIGIKQQPCPNGIIYSCCDGNSTSSGSNPSTPGDDNCWDTGCQLNSWAVRGCEQYNMVEIQQIPCENGIIYSCCSKKKSPDGFNPVPGMCFETDCQSHSWEAKGCQYNMIEKGQRSCDYGIIYNCCIPPADVTDSIQSSENAESIASAASNY